MSIRSLRLVNLSLLYLKQLSLWINCPNVNGGKPIKSFNNPWIEIMAIGKESTQDTLESRYNELTTVNKETSQLQMAKLKLESSVAALENQAIREGLHVQMTNDKLEEFSYI